MERIELVEPCSITNREREEYRTLRTNLEFTGVENRVITITSCTPNEGKSTVSYYLAVALAESGKSTLFIDADMRKSVFTKRFSVEGKRKGLSHLLSGQSEVKDVIYSTNKEMLYLLPVGKFPSNPTELLANGCLEKLLPALKGMFDYVVIDTPPLGSVIDAAVIAKYSDASMLVLASNVSAKREAKKIVNQLKMANSNFLGVVLNKVDVKDSGYYYKRYGGFYGYGRNYNKYYE